MIFPISVSDFSQPLDLESNPATASISTQNKDSLDAFLNLMEQNSYEKQNSSMQLEIKQLVSDNDNLSEYTSNSFFISNLKVGHPLQHPQPQFLEPLKISQFQNNRIESIISPMIADSANTLIDFSELANNIDYQKSSHYENLSGRINYNDLPRQYNDLGQTSYNRELCYSNFNDMHANSFSNNLNQQISLLTPQTASSGFHGPSQSSFPEYFREGLQYQSPQFPEINYVSPIGSIMGSMPIMPAMQRFQLASHALKRTKSSKSNNTCTSEKNSKNIISSRRKTVLESCTCSGSCAREVSLVYMRGTAECLEKTYIIQIVCERCLKMDTNATLFVDRITDESFTDNNFVKTTRKRNRDTRCKIECEVCRKLIGTGGIKPLNNSTDDFFDENDLSVEYVCLPCGSKYLFCSECGGGGKTRTGKWRPKELFEAGRRTCSLPHIRIGNAPLKQDVLLPEIDLNEQVLQNIQDVFFDCNMSLYAVPSFMETNRFQSFASIGEEITNLWKNSVLNVLMEPRSETIRKYLIIEWMEKPHRNKGKSKTRESSSPWLRRLSLDSTDGFDLKSYSVALNERCYIAFAIAEWNISTKCIGMLQMAPRSVFLRPAETYGELLKATVGQIQKDAHEENLPMPEYMWCWTRADNNRAKSLPERLGFIKKSEFLNLNPYTQSCMFERPNFVPLHEPGVVIHCINIDANCGLRQNLN